MEITGVVDNATWGPREARPRLTLRMFYDGSATAASLTGMKARVILVKDEDPKPYGPEERTWVSGQLSGVAPYQQAELLLDKLVDRGWAPPLPKAKFKVEGGRVCMLREGEDRYDVLTATEVVRRLNDAEEDRAQ